MKTIRCAVYTRKSNEEGLDQAFNSLDAQRQAGLDYISSQKHEGWVAIPTRYDDGGFSGGTMKRPALTQLLDDIDRGRVDAVVVYKVDRLSRSLGDFAGMMRLFEDKRVSFVSVTQQFNTTTSMGRLTLNILLSFAQFEREVAGERIRDKIAATVKKGYWVCGQPPLGYRRQLDGEERGLYIVPEEADLVREIFTTFIRTKSLVAAAEALTQKGHTTKRWTSSAGRVHGGRPLTQKYIYNILTNPLYIGKVTHTRDRKTQTYDGLHEPIIDRPTWGRAHALITVTDRNTLHRWTHPHQHKGKQRTGDGFAISPTSTHRPLTKNDPGPPADRQKRLVRYYVSQKAIKHGFKSCPIKSVNAEHLDELVRAVVLDHLDHEPLGAQAPETRDHWIRAVIVRVTLSEQTLAIDLDPDQVRALRSHEFDAPADPPPARPTCPHRPKFEARDAVTRLILNIQIKKHDGRRLILSPEGRDLVLPSRPEPRQHIVDAIGLAYRWHDDLVKTGQHIRAYAQANGIARSRIMKLLPLVHLGPEALRAALTGALPPSLTLDDLLDAAKSLDWKRQARSLGLDRAGQVA